MSGASRGEGRLAEEKTITALGDPAQSPRNGARTLKGAMARQANTLGDQATQLGHEERKTERAFRASNLSAKDLRTKEEEKL